MASATMDWRINRGNINYAVPSLVKNAFLYSPYEAGKQDVCRVLPPRHSLGTSHYPAYMFIYCGVLQ